MSSKTFVRFWAGLRTIGGTVITIEYEDAKIVFDFGASYNPVANVLDGQVKLRQDALLHDYIRLGILPPVDGLYKEGQLREMPFIRPYDPVRDEKTAVFISHLHLDHMLGIGCILDPIPIYMTKPTRSLYRRLYELGEGVEGTYRRYHAMLLYQPIRVGAIEVTALPMDHDVAGACAFHIRTPDGTFFYTGDFRFHGLHPERTSESVAKAKALGTDVLIIEGTMLRLPDHDGAEVDDPDELVASLEQPPGYPTEAETPQRIAEQLEAAQGLALFNVTTRNVERLLAMIVGAERAGRIAVLEPESAYLLLTLTDCSRFLVYESSETRRQSDSGTDPRWLRKVKRHAEFISAKTINSQPSRYMLQNSYAHLLELFDLNLDEGIYIHSDGVPLGAFDPTYAKLLAFLERLNLQFVPIRCSGHAPAEHLKHVVDTIDPQTLVPLHSFHPELLKPKSGVQLLPEYNYTYRLEKGRLL
ncbi:MBL fold metallo-hydrolase [Paenibacillus sp. RC67]|uniref:MBL fold metallo-hydrolase n=1 Tax=Paenibacillus sp. RC67 TaxID=3039392 RepID=UPI0024AE1334|nr:MBL fold metallo-hydrolase [Paenibacillus sp. RC67]